MFDHGGRLLTCPATPWTVVATRKNASQPHSLSTPCRIFLKKIVEMASDTKFDYGEKTLQADSQDFLRAPSIELSFPDDSHDTQGTRRSRSRTISNVGLPFLSTSTSDENEKLSNIFPDTVPGKSHKPAKAEHESRKLLAHILGQLDRRRHAPSLWDSFTKENTGEKSEKRFELFRTGKPRGRQTRKDNTSRTESLDESDSEDDREFSGAAFSTDDTFDLICQLKEVLWISKLQGWSIFVDRCGVRFFCFFDNSEPFCHR